jgi:protease-4
MKTHPQLFAKLFASPLMIHEPVRLSLENALLSRMKSGSLAAGDETPTAAAAAIGSKSAAPSYMADIGAQDDPDQDWLRWNRKIKATERIIRIEDVYQKHGNVATIKVHGVIDKVLTRAEMQCYGGCDLQDIDNALAIAAADPQISHIVLDIHSPGGSVVGVAETASRIAALRDTHEVHAYIAGQACSAAYYLASQADVISAGESAAVGSIGVYMAILDASRWYAEEGLNMQVLKGGEMKTMGASWRPLTDAERSYLQAQVDSLYNDFKAACTQLRTIADSTMQGQWMSASEGHSLKLVDNLTRATLDEYVTDLIR